jgi:hypothetical protein
MGAADHGLVEALALVEIVAVDEARLGDEGEGAVDGGLGDGGLVAPEEFDEVVGGDSSAATCPLTLRSFWTTRLRGPVSLSPWVFMYSSIAFSCSLMPSVETESQSQNILR